MTKANTPTFQPGDIIINNLYAGRYGYLYSIILEDKRGLYMDNFYPNDLTTSSVFRNTHYYVLYTDSMRE